MTDLDRILNELAEQGSRTAGQADPSEIRREGDARRQRRIAGGVAAIVVVVVAVVVTAVGASFALPANQIVVVPAAQPPIATPTPQRHALAEDPFLPGPFGWPGTYDGLKRTENTEAFMPACLPAMKELGADQVEAADYFGDSEASVKSSALEFATAADAEVAVADILELPESCYEETYDRDTTVHEPRDRGAGDEAYVFAQESIPNEHNAGSSTSYFGYGIVRDANIVVVIEFGAMSMPVDENPYATWSADRLNKLITKAVS